MPKQKDLKRIVRSRMQKTGESYSTARLQVLRKAKLSEPTPDYSSLAGMSDVTIRKKTGHGWAEWVETLDAARAAEKPHREIAEYVSTLGTPDWWSQAVTVGYERIRGLRDKGQRRGGPYEASKSRTFAVPVSKLYHACVNARTRSRWLGGVKFKVRTAIPNKTIRITWEDDTVVQLYFTVKGDRKSQVAVQHQKLADRAAVEKAKTFWTERLAVLSKVLAR